MNIFKVNKYVTPYTPHIRTANREYGFDVSKSGDTDSENRYGRFSDKD
jgi:hypothetical protein